MNSGKLKLKSLGFKLLGISIFIFLVFFMLNFQSPKNNDASLRISTGDDSSGIIINYMIKNYKVNASVDFNLGLESTTMLDCWGANGKWALSSGSLDIAIICSDAADDILDKSNDFINIGSVVENSDVIVSKKKEIKKVGISQGREYKKSIASKRFKNIEIISVLDRSLGYALEKGEVDAILIDAKKALVLAGIKEGTSTIKGDYSAYTMIANKNIINTEKYKRFVEVYNKSVDDFNKESTIQEFIKLNLGEDKNWKGGLEDWKNWHVKFLKIPQ